MDQNEYRLEVTEPLGAAEELQLLARAQAGDRAAIGKLFGAFGPTLINFAQQHCSTEVTLAEALSEAATLLAECIHKFDPARGARLHTYLHHVLKTRMRRRVQRLRRLHTSMSSICDEFDTPYENLIFDPARSPVETVAIAEECTEAKTWLAILASRDKKAAHVVGRRILDGASWQEIRGELGLPSLDRVRDHYRAGLQQLKQLSNGRTPL